MRTDTVFPPMTLKCKEYIDMIDSSLRINDKSIPEAELTINMFNRRQGDAIITKLIDAVNSENGPYRILEYYSLEMYISPQVGTVHRDTCRIYPDQNLPQAVEEMAHRFLSSIIKYGVYYCQGIQPSPPDDDKKRDTCLRCGHTWPQRQTVWRKGTVIPGMNYMTTFCPLCNSESVGQYTVSRPPMRPEDRYCRDCKRPYRAGSVDPSRFTPDMNFAIGRGMLNISWICPRCLGIDTFGMIISNPDHSDQQKDPIDSAD